MFYLFLIILSFIEFYFFRLFNQIVINGSSFSGDIFFALFGIIISMLFLEGTTHIKHLNREWLKRVSQIIIIIAILYFLATCLSFNLKYIISSLEISIILIIAGCFLYRYQTVPEGEPDIEDEILEEEKISDFDYIESFDLYDDSGLYDSESNVYSSDKYVDPNLSNLNNIVIDLKEKNIVDDMEEKIKKVFQLVENIFNANSEYRDDNLNDLIYIFTYYNNELENGENPNNIEQINNSLDLISSNLENIYYNTRGAQVFKVEKEIKALKEKLEGTNI